MQPHSQPASLLVCLPADLLPGRLQQIAVFSMTRLSQQAVDT